MAVRSFDLSEPQAPRLTAFDAPRIGRRELRRVRHRYATVGIVALAIPFVAALVVLGAVH
jgi:hypothetical protein